MKFKVGDTHNMGGRLFAWVDPNLQQLTACKHSADVFDGKGVTWAQVYGKDLEQLAERTAAVCKTLQEDD